MTIRPATRLRSRKAAAALAALGAAGAVYTTLIEPRRLRVRRLSVALPDWPEALADLKVALVADLHAGAPHVDEQRVEQVVAVVNRTKPDLIALLGDYVDPEVAFGEVVAPEAVAARLAGLEAPLGTFAVLGNHDWRSDGERVLHALREHRIEVLENDAASVSLAGQVIWIVGLADPSESRPDIATPLSLVPRGAPLIVLSHDPDLFNALPEDRPMLVLAGHTHGAQVNVPVVREKVTPSRFGERFAGGLFRRGSRTMYVSRGIGTSKLPIRFRATPEVVILSLAGSARS
jgi:predicted MPP superfamily phosphohydrolase